MTKSLMGTYALWQFIGMLVVWLGGSAMLGSGGTMWYLLALFFGE